MKWSLFILAVLFATSVQGARPSKADKAKERAQYSRRDVSHVTVDIAPSGDTTAINIYLNRVPCFSKPVDMSKHRKLVRDFRKVYPLALVAREKMAGFEEQLLALPTRKAQREFSKRTEKSLIAEYEPTMRRMTVSQGKILVRLIDRETEMTSHQIIKEFRGGFVAGFWQGVARIFGHNLKDEYDALERDRLIEQCIVMYNLGLLPEW